MIFRYKNVIIPSEVEAVKEKYILNPLSRKLLYTGMPVCIAAYFFVMLDIYRTVTGGAVILSNVYAMIENVSMTLLLVVAAALILDIHIKRGK